MTEKITIEEAKRRRAARERSTRPAPHDEPPSNLRHINGRVRDIEVTGWNALGEIAAQDNMVGGLLGEEQFAMLYGESGSGKSFLAFDMAAHYALARPWLGHPVKGGGVLYIAAEGRGGWANRVEAFCRHYDLDEEARAMIPFGFVLEGVNLGRSGGPDVAAVIRACERQAERIEKAIDLIIVDTMARATPGSNENDAGDMGAFVGNMDVIRQRTKATQLIVHHAGKNLALGARGHSSLRAAVDAELEVERRNGSRILRVRKNRDGNDGFEQGFNLLSVEIGRDQQDQAITSCVIQPAEIAEHEPRRAPKASPRWQLGLPTLDAQLIDFPEHHPSPKVTRNLCTNFDRLKEALERASIIDGETDNRRRGQWFEIKRAWQNRKIVALDDKLRLIWRVDV